jgi:hypothetical protein
MRKKARPRDPLFPHCCQLREASISEDRVVKVFKVRPVFPEIFQLFATLALTPVNFWDPEKTQILLRLSVLGPAFFPPLFFRIRAG